MAVERLKFRCYQCNQLLASLPSKAGSIVSCPRCKADLVVPAPDSPAPADPDTSPFGKAFGRAESTIALPKSTAPADLDESAAAIPADLIDLRPEDLRVEAEFFGSLSRAPAPPAEPEPAPWGEPAPPAPFPNVETGFPAAPAYSPAAIETAAALFPASPEAPGVVRSPARQPPLLPPASPDVPPIEIEPPSLLAPNREFHPVREVVLPASAVLAWSIFGLIGIATSFLAGLMVGHYFWRM